MKNIFKRIGKIKLESLLNKSGFQKFIIFTVLYLFLLIFNYDNKTFVVSSFVYLCIASRLLNSFSMGLIFSYLLFNLFSIGKTYEILLIPSYYLSYGTNLIGYEGHYDYLIISSLYLIGTLMSFWYILKYFQLKSRFDGITFILILYYLSTLISLLLSKNIAVSLFFWWGSFSLFALFQLLRSELKNNKYFLSQLLPFLAVLTIYESVYTLIQYLLHRSFVSSLEFVKGITFQGIDIDTSWFRPWGTLNHPNILGNFLMPLIIIFFLFGYKSKIKNAGLYFIACTSGVITIILTLNRSAWILIFLIITFSTLIIEKQYKLRLNKLYARSIKYILIICIPLFVLFIFPRMIKSVNTFSEGGSSSSRIQLTIESLDLIAKYPLFGVGYGMSILAMFENNPTGEMYNFPTVVHNLYLQTASETGIISLFLLIIFIAFLLKNRNKKPGIQSKLDSLVFKSGIISLLLNGLVQPNYSTTLIYLILLSTIIYEKNK